MSPPDPGLGRFFDLGGGSSATLFAGRPFHFAYESFALRLLFLADLPALIASSLAQAVVDPILRAFGAGSYFGSYVAAILLLTVASVQWMLLGRLVESWLERSARWNGLRPRLNVVSAAVVAVILTCTAVAIPLVNERSRQLGFRHAGISLHPPRR